MLPVEEEPVRRKVSRKWWIAVPVLLFTLSFFDIHNDSINSWAYRYAVDALVASKDIVAVVGEPVEIGFSWRAKLSDNRSSLHIPFSGPRGRGNAYIYAAKKNGEWGVEEFHATIEETGKRINLK